MTNELFEKVMSLGTDYKIFIEIMTVMGDEGKKQPVIDFRDNQISFQLTEEDGSFYFKHFTMTDGVRTRLLNQFYKICSQEASLLSAEISNL